MKKRFLIILIIIFTSILIPETEIVENVEVDWWILPVFAVDKNDDSVADLTSNDLEVFINGMVVKEFTIYKREFNVERGEEERSEMKNVPLKRKIAFLIFDTAFSAMDNLGRSIAIAKDLIAKGSDTTSFVVMVVEAYAGLQYKGGPESDKDILYAIIDKEVKINERGRSLEPAITAIHGAQISGNKGEKYSEEDVAFLSDEITSSLRNTNKNFFFSFESLYYSLNQISDHKFIYFFSEGLSFWSRKSSRHSEEQYFRDLKRSADFMGQSGSVIFVINPSGYESGEITQTGGGFAGMRAGPDSLKYIASESGGRYLRGNKKDLSERFEKMNRAYYEVAFSDTGIPEGGTGEIEIRSKRKDVRLHSLRKLEKRKKYSQMKKIEKEVLALNLLGSSSLFKPTLSIRGFTVISRSVRKDHTDVKLELPGDYERKYVDLFIIDTDPETGITESVKMVKKPVPGNLVNLEISGGNRERKKLVLIDEKNNIAYVEGVIDFDERLMKQLVSMNRKFDEKIGKVTEQQKSELKKVLMGAADYCSNLENAAFHFVCREDIEELLKVIRRGFSSTRETFNPQTGIMVRSREPGAPPRKSLVSNLKHRYIYDYQLIVDKGKITEQRRILKGKEKDRAASGSSLNVDSFLSRKIVLSPISILGIANQGRYKFRYVKQDRVDGAEAIQIEVFPKKLDQSESIYGTIWIDASDHSIIRIEVNPVSIGGFTTLMKLASDLGSILDVKCTIDFGLKRNGIRFPTRVRIRELYHGGDFLKRVMRMNSWEKSRITYRYLDYKFFEVDTEVKVQK